MNKEEREDLPSYGDLLAENFRLKHNENILQARIDKAIEYIEEDYKRIIEMQIGLPIEIDTSMPIYDDLLKILKGE